MRDGNEPMSAPTWGDRLAPAVEMYRMVRDRRTWVLAPMLVAIVGLLVFMTAAEMPVLIPFFYAVF
ncbi:MAG: hypothetical protein ACON5B_11980 [Myxococcota bacterium]